MEESSLVAPSCINLKNQNVLTELKSGFPDTDDRVTSGGVLLGCR